MKYGVIGIFLLSLLVILNGCPSGPPVADNFISSPLNGKIFDHDNLPCGDVVITVDNFTKVKSDINGRFVIPDLTRGTHQLVCRKESYEEITIDYNFLNQNDVLWIKMISLEQLIRQIDDKFFNNKWDETNDLFERAAKIDPDDPVLLYLTSVLYLHNGWVENALEVLLDMIEKGNNEPTIYLSIADIYQYKMNDPALAFQYLEKYITMVHDEDAYKRVETLRAYLPENETE
ncbi:MAG: hypothetical protein JW881_09675 [Spirochaetales bacterium]|nr:hypothetical protein [Spirochaetales bacterium]